MITLDRHFNQVIRINDEISITVLQFTNGKVKIGIQAPKEVPVMRCKIVDYRVPASQRGGQEPQPPEQKESPLGSRLLDVKRRNAGRLRVIHADDFGEGAV